MSICVGSRRSGVALLALAATVLALPSAAVGLVSTAVTAPQSAASASAAQDGKAPNGKRSGPLDRPAHDFALTDLRGLIVESAYPSRPVTVVHFWASWCVPCMREIPELNRLAERYEPAGAAIFAVAMESGSAGELRQIEKTYEIRHHVLVGDDRVARGFGELAAFPVTFLVDGRGRIVERHDGASRETQHRIEETIRGLLAASGRPLPKR